MGRPEYSEEYQKLFNKLTKYEEGLRKTRKLLRDLDPLNIPFAGHKRFDMSNLRGERLERQHTRVNGVRRGLRNAEGILISRREDVRSGLRSFEEESGVSRPGTTLSSQTEERVLQEGTQSTIIPGESETDTSITEKERGHLEETRGAQQTLEPEIPEEPMGRSRLVYTSSGEGPISNIDVNRIRDSDRRFELGQTRKQKKKEKERREDAKRKTSKGDEREKTTDIENDPGVRKTIDKYLAELDENGLGFDEWIQGNRISQLFLPRITETDIKNFKGVLKVRKGENPNSFMILGNEIPVLRFVHDYFHLNNKVMDNKLVKYLRVVLGEVQAQRQREKEENKPSP